MWRTEKSDPICKKEKKMCSLKSLQKSNDTETPIKSVVGHSWTERNDLKMQNKMIYAAPKHDW